jgi:RHS repeat-associated protein
MNMPGRNANPGDYRYGFNGKEEDVEGMGGGKATYDYGFRIYNPAIGRFLSVDPLTNEFPWYTPYQFAGNMPIVAIDLDGLEEFLVHVYRNHNRPYLVTVTYISRKSERACANNETYVVFFHDDEKEGVSLNRLNPNIDKNTSSVTYHGNKSFAKPKWNADEVFNIDGLSENSIILDGINEFKKEFPDYQDALENERVTTTSSIVKPFTITFSTTNDEPKLNEDVASAYVDDLLIHMIKDPKLKVTITGYASPLGKKEKNIEYAGKRAVLSKEFFGKRLNSLGVSKSSSEYKMIMSRIDPVNGGIRNSENNNDTNANNIIDRSAEVTIQDK